jgi:basic membrane protein A
VIFMKRLLVFLAFVLIAVTAIGAAPAHKIGLVFDMAGRGDNSFNDSAYNGLVQIAKTYKGWIEGDPDKVNFGSDLQIKYLEPKAGGQDREILMRALAEDGYELVYGVGYAFADIIAKVGKDFPKTYFAGIDCDMSGASGIPNVLGLNFRENEGSFLVGAIAALKAKGQKVGFIGGVTIPLIQRFENGFKGGAMWVNPVYRKEGNILSQYISKEFTGFNDPTGGYNVATALFKQGAAIIYHAAGGSGDGLFRAAAELKKLAIGVDSDQGLIYAADKDPAIQARGKVILTSMIKRVDNAVILTAKEYLASGKLVGGNKVFGLKEGGVGFAENDLNKSALADVRMQVLRIANQIMSGAIAVPDENTNMAAWAKTLK